MLERPGTALIETVIRPPGATSCGVIAWIARRQPSDLVRRWFEDLFTGGDLAVAGDILAEDVEYRGPPSLSPTDVSGPADIREFVEVYWTAFPDLRYTVEQMGTSDETLLVRWTGVGTHESDLFGMEPTGESFAVEGISVFGREDGVITDVYAQWDTLNMVQELGTVSAEWSPA